MSILALWLLSGLAQQVDTAISRRSAFVQVNGVRVHYLECEPVGCAAESLYLTDQ